MILPRIDVDGFLDAVANAPLIAFQKVQYGLAVAAPANFAFYAPVAHPGGGNLPEEFANKLGVACINRICNPRLRTLRPTARPVPTIALLKYLETLNHLESFEEMFKHVPGDHPAVIEFQTQVVIQAIEEHGRPDLQATMDNLKLDAMSDALDLVIDHAGAARELCEVGEDKPHALRLNIMQAVQAMKSALELLLKP